MASTAAPKISLPSINEMLPEYMMGGPFAPLSDRSSTPRTASSPTVGSRTPPELLEHHYVPRLQSGASPLVHPQPAPYAAAPTPAGPGALAPSVAYNESRPAVQTFRLQVPAHVHHVQDHAYLYQQRSASSEAGPSVSPYLSAPQTLYRPTSSDERKHCCPHCNKRFNRPSSLNIHVNTHTGAKPFECPFPGCNRKFNVNSNMRRHWRNHIAGTRRREPGPSSPASPSPSPSEEEDAPYTYTHTRPRSRSSPVPRFSPSVATSETLVVGGGPDTDRLVAGRPRADTCSIPGCACRRPPYPTTSVRTMHYSYPR